MSSTTDAADTRLRVVDDDDSETVEIVLMSDYDFSSRIIKYPPPPQPSRRHHHHHHHHRPSSPTSSSSSIMLMREISLEIETIEESEEEEQRAEEEDEKETRSDHGDDVVEGGQKEHLLEEIRVDSMDEQQLEELLESISSIDDEDMDEFLRSLHVNGIPDEMIPPRPTEDRSPPASPAGSSSSSSNSSSHNRNNKSLSTTTAAVVKHHHDHHHDPSALVSPSDAQQQQEQFPELTNTNSTESSGSCCNQGMDCCNRGNDGTVEESSDEQVVVDIASPKRVHFEEVHRHLSTVLLSPTAGIGTTKTATGRREQERSWSVLDDILKEEIQQLGATGSLSPLSFPPQKESNEVDTEQTDEPLPSVETTKAQEDVSPFTSMLLQKKQSNGTVTNLDRILEGLRAYNEEFAITSISCANDPATKKERATQTAPETGTLPTFIDVLELDLDFNDMTNKSSYETAQKSRDSDNSSQSDTVRSQKLQQPPQSEGVALKGGGTYTITTLRMIALSALLIGLLRITAFPTTSSTAVAKEQLPEESRATPLWLQIENGL